MLTVFIFAKKSSRERSRSLFRKERRILNMLANWTPAVPLLGDNLGQVVYMHVPLSASSINWYRSKRQLCPTAGKVTVGMSSHWPCHRLQWFIHLCVQWPKAGR